MVTVGLVLHCPYITDFVIYPPTDSKVYEREMITPLMVLYGLWSIGTPLPLPQLTPIQLFLLNLNLRASANTFTSQPVHSLFGNERIMVDLHPKWHWDPNKFIIHVSTMYTATSL